MRSRCSCRLRSPISLQFCRATREPNFSSKCAEPRVISRRSNQLETGTNRLSDTGSASLLRPLQEFDWNLNSDLASDTHTRRIPYPVPAFRMGHNPSRQLHWPQLYYTGELVHIT